MSKVRPTIYNHSQIAPSTTWVVNHNLGGNGSSGFPIVEVIANRDGIKTKMIPFEITVNDKNTLTVSFTTAQSGSALILI